MSAPAAERAIAAVVVIPPIEGHETLLYSVPPSLRDELGEGMRVLVPLGPRQVTGIVVGFPEAAPGVELRDVLDRLDAEPLVGPDLLALCRFAASYYMTSAGEVFATAVLAGLRAESRRVVRRLGLPEGAAPPALGKTERGLLDRLPERGPARVTTLARVLGSSRAYEGLRALARRGLVAIEELPARSAMQIRRVRIVLAACDPDAEEAAALERRAPEQWRVWQRIRAAGAAGIAAPALGARASAAIRALGARGWLRVETREVYRDPLSGDVASAPAPPPATLTPAQASALEALEAAIAAGRFEGFLLHGVTGSGKTEVYFRAAARTLALGRGVLWLVPEIGLTHELVGHVRARFGGAAALLHSALAPGERFDEWRRLARREARIAVGVRSAVWAPLRNLGLVIVDEEHDGAYKQDDGLRYNARDLALVRARDARCPAVLGSATPSIESHQHAAAGRYRLLALPERVEGRPLPPVELVDLRTEKPEGKPPVFAPRLAAAIEANLAAGGQTLLFLNRRGYAHYLQCAVCGHVPGCPNCSVTLTFHLAWRRLRCHHCDYALAAPELCPECTGPSLRDVGVGTEQLESAVRARFPTARIARLDRDVTARRGALGRILGEWRRGALDVLIGTQIVTKGHDVPGVTLVGVVAADQALNLPDFRSAERTFQMLAQVAGRAGRGANPGRVLVQTHRPTHYALASAARHDFAGFAEQEIRNRDALSYPPFARLANLRVDGPDEARVEALARELAQDLRVRNGAMPRSRQCAILGPAPAPLEKLRGRWRWQVLVKGRTPAVLRDVVRPAAETARAAVRRAGARLAVDVDPYGML